MKRVVGGNALIEGLIYLNSISKNGYAEYDAGKRKTFVIFSPDRIEKIFIQKQKYFSRGITFIKMKNFFGNGLITSEDPDHIQNKRVMQKSFHKKHFDSFLYFSFNVANNLFINNNKVSISELSDNFSFDSVSQCLLGTKFPREYIDIYHGISEKIANIPHLHFDDNEMEDFNKIKKSLSKYIENNNSEFISNLNENMNHDQVLDEVLTILGAGFETTSALNIWTLINIEQNINILNQLREDTPDWVKESRPPKFDELFQSNLLNNVIKETLRMYPPVYFSTRMVSEDFNFDGIKMQKGENIFLSQYVAHRDENNYNNAREWNPNRWTPEFEKTLHKGSYFPFGLGSRKCIGEQLAKSLVYIFISMFIYKYDFKLIDRVPEPDYLVSMIPSGKVMMELTER